jgi:hypothetical protein
MARYPVVLFFVGWNAFNDEDAFFARLDDSFDRVDVFDEVDAWRIVTR